MILSTSQFRLPGQQPQTGGRVDSVQSPVSVQLVAEARRMIAEFKTTRYSHKTSIDRERGICEVDCSGFLVVLLKSVAPENLQAVHTKHKRPLADDFYRAITAHHPGVSKAWREIPRVGDAQPGDVLVWLKLERQPGDNTGHVMLLAAKPVQESPHQFRVRVLDSTLHGHADDTRPEGTSGIGEGTIWLSIDALGKPSGYRWKSKTGTLHDVPIVIGRAVSIRH